MIDDQVIEPDNEEEEDLDHEQEEPQSDIERLIEVLMPPASDEEIDQWAFNLKPLQSLEADVAHRIAAAIERGQIIRAQELQPKKRTK